MQSGTEPEKEQQGKVHWSLKSCFWVAVAITLIATAVVVLLMHKPVWVELETLAIVIGVMMTIFYSYILYHGVKFLDEQTVTFFKPVNNSFTYGADAAADLFAYFTGTQASAKALDLFMTVFPELGLCLILAFVLFFLLWFGVNLVATSVIIIAIPLFYIFKRSLMFVVRHVDECRGNLSKSVQYAFGYALLKTATLCLMVFASHGLANVVKVSILGR